MAIMTREIKRRIRSVTSTRKITKAMELVAAAKMRRAVKAVLASRAYSHAAWQIVKELSSLTDPSLHPLLQKRDKVKKVGLIMMTSNRGLCGGFNHEIIDTVAEYIRHHSQDNVEIEAEVLLMGKRGRDIMYKHGHEIVAEFAKVDVATRVTEVTPLAKMVIADYVSGKYDKVIVAYTDYYSAMKQKPRIKRILPIGHEDDELGAISGVQPVANNENDNEYLFEPSTDIVLDQMLARLIEVQLYQALLESNASEHSSRMMAMRNASDAASDMISELTLTFNQARQQMITSELADISSGSAAVS
ncbi:MAG: ATP synthase F1 subunit gamma [Patescibacteria group bacterium]